MSILSLNKLFTRIRDKWHDLKMSLTLSLMCVENHSKLLLLDIHWLKELAKI